MKALLDRFLPHASSITIIGGTIIYYLLGNHAWMDQYLPENGKPLVVFLVIALVVVYEILLNGQKAITASLARTDNNIMNISRQMEINRLKQDVNSIYFRVRNNNTTIITNENTIKEINELKDVRLRLGVNSYTESRLKHLCSLIQL